jgi:hypothetical protein
MSRRQRRASSDEQEKQLLQNETAKKQSKCSGAKKIPAENSAKPRSPLAPQALREKILIWQDFNGVHKNRCIRECCTWRLTFQIIPRLAQASD